MALSAAMLVDCVLPHQPIRQWVLSVLFPCAGFTHKTAKGGGKIIITALETKNFCAITVVILA